MRSTTHTVILSDQREPKDLRTNSTLYVLVVRRSLDSIIISLGMTNLWIADPPAAQARQIQGDHKGAPTLN